MTLALAIGIRTRYNRALARERINLIQQLEEEDKKALFRIIDSRLTKSKFKEFFNKNVAAL